MEHGGGGEPGGASGKIVGWMGVWVVVAVVVGKGGDAIETSTEFKARDD